MSLKLLLSSLFLLSAAFLPFAATSQSKAHSQATAKASTKHPAATTSSVHQEEGQRIFEQNCSRCHTAPDGFSPRISGTVMRHMRVRASLSLHDEQELLRFLNP